MTEVFFFFSFVSCSEAINLYCFLCFSKGDPRKVRPSSTFDMDKLKSTIKQFVRDWSEAGKAERDSCYKPIIEEIQRLFPPDQW